MTGIHPFEVSFSAAGIDDLRRRLQQAIYPDELDNVNWDLGSPLTDVQWLAKHWATSFNFKQAEARLNDLPQYITTIDCDGFGPLDIHFVHIRSEDPRAIPLLFSHGWPGSFIEVYKIAQELAKGGQDSPAFHVIAPSLPNYGFSSGVRKRGFAIEQYAETCHKLMLKLGYEKYVTQGGDWGWYVTRTMSLLYPSHVLATHFNMDVGDAPQGSSTSKPDDFTAYETSTDSTTREVEGAKRTAWFENESYGYNLLQSTKPQTLAYALADSPIALLAWIYEKLHDWSDHYLWTDDEICTWISIYWFSKAGPAASCRIYYEMIHDVHGRYVPASSDGTGFEAANGKQKVTRRWLKKDHGTGVKIGQSHFPGDIHVLPSAWTKTIGNVVFETEHEGGGHFAAWERPQELVDDLRAMFRGLQLN